MSSNRCGQKVFLDDMCRRDPSRSKNGLKSILTIGDLHNRAFDENAFQVIEGKQKQGIRRKQISPPQKTGLWTKTQTGHLRKKTGLSSETPCVHSV